jgi:Protein of unknown function (DUF2805).
MNRTYLELLKWHGKIEPHLKQLSESMVGESEVIRLMRYNLKSSSFKLWRKRMAGRKTKHQQLRSPEVERAYCSRQYKYA